MTDRTPDLMEALWAAGEFVGRRLSAADQVAVAREISRSNPNELSAESVTEIFARVRVQRPTPAYAKAIVTRVQGVPSRLTLLDVLISYRQFAIRELSGQFGGKTKGREEELRNSLLTFLPQRGFTEARSGRGRTDILLPPPPSLRIVEVKVWTTPRLYEDGLEELARYINTERPDAAYMVVFGDRIPLPSIVADHKQAIVETRNLEGVLVPVVLVPFEVDQPSKAASKARGRNRDGRR